MFGGRGLKRGHADKMSKIVEAYKEPFPVIIKLVS